MKIKHRFSIISVLLALALICFGAAFITACGGSTEHTTHTYSTDYKYDETYHWHYCTIKGCDATTDVEEHTYDYENYTTNSSGEYVYTCTACGYQLTESSAIYSVTVTNIGGTAISGVDVTLYNISGSKIDSGTTSSSGNVRFRNLSAGTYNAYIDDSTLPIGYSLEDNWVQLTVSSKSATVIATSAIITDAEMPSNTVYSVGDVVYDFTVTCYDTDGSSYTVTLSEYLEKYNAVIINFFYTTCSPCIQEVPYMEQAYEDYSGKIGLIAFDYTGAATTDTVSRMIDFKQSNGLTWDFTLDTSSYYARYNVTGFPTTVVIDRYGIIAEIETGSNISAASWINMFEYYISDSYEPSYTTSKRDDTTDTQVESDVEMPSSEEIAEAIVTTNSYTTASTFTFSNYSEDGEVDVYNWPWVIGEGTVSGVSDYITTSNAGIVGGYSIIVIDVTLEAGQAVLFDYIVSTEDDYDIFYVQVDTLLQLETSGQSSGWQTCLAYVAQYDGDYQITLYYQKDSSKNVNDDAVYVSNLRVINQSEISSYSDISTDILYNAATNYTTDSTIDLDNYGEGYGYLNYVSVYKANDGYYHVGSKADGSDPEDDPYLLADIYYGTPWYSTMSVWYEVYALGTEVNTTLAGTTNFGTVYDAFEDYAWAQNNCPLNYIPVNQELHDMLVAFVSYYGRTSGDSLDNQWLELCRYYIHYGADHDDSGDCYSLDNIAETYGIRYAKAIGEVSSTANTDNGSAVTFTADMPTILVPRGNYYSFTVDKDGVYRIYSYNVQGDSEAAPYAFIMDKDENTLGSAESDDLSYVDGFVRDGATGSFTISGSGTEYKFTAAYSGTYDFTLTGSSTAAIYSGADDDGTRTCYLESGSTSFSLTLTAGTEYIFQLTGASSATLGYEIESYDFGMYVYLKAGQTYYIGCSFGSTEETGSYDVGIYYIGDKLVYLATMATDSYYTYREVVVDGTTTYEYYVPVRVNGYALNPDDGCWWTLDENGELDQLIYIDMVGTTWWNYYSSYTLQQTIEGNLYSGWNEAAIETLTDYLAEALANNGTVNVTAGSDSLYGLVPAYSDLVSLINILCNGGDSSTSTTYADNAWMLTAYFVRTIDENS